MKKLIEQMSLEEKISMIHGAELFKTAGIPRLGIPPLVMSDGPMGVRREFEGTSWAAPDLSDDYSSYLPCNTALAATWNRGLAYESGKVLGMEARGRGKDVILAPGINIARTPLCGRNYEYMTEDPYLAGELAVPFIKGIEENDVAACVKHFVANNQEVGRMTVSVEMSEQALREIYLPAFEKAVKEAKSKTIMSAYNRFRGVYCSENSDLLKTILREEWGYEGVVISDWGAVHHTEEAALNGLDIEMNITATKDEYFMAAPLLEAVKAGRIPEAVIDEKVEHILKLMKQLHMLEGERQAGGYNRAESREKTLQVAREAIVLLKNEEAILPFKALKSLAVIGDNAERLHASGGDSAQVKALYEISPLMGMKMRLGGNTKVSFARGYSKDQAVASQLLKEALKVAGEAEAVLFVGGLNHEIDQEGSDKSDLDLPYGQSELIQALLAVNPNTVIVMLSGTPVDMRPWIKEAKAVVQTWYAGMEGGYALAEVLMGDVTPSGKLPITFPLQLQDCPAHHLGEYPGNETVSYNEGVFVGYRYYNSFEVPVLFEFGYGLSYTQFDYEALKLEQEGDCINVSFYLKNIGKVKGAEVAQLYIQRERGQAVYRSLKAFEKVVLEPGAIQEVKLVLNKQDFMNYREKGWQLETHHFKVAIGSSVEKIKLIEDIEIK